MNRREFLIATAATPAAVPAPAAEEGPSARPVWIDPRLASLPQRPWRKVHLDFHNSHHVPRIGEKFDANEFGDRLSAANVNAIVVFAKDMHGYFYYPSRFGPVHPGLDFDLLGAQVEACRKRNIAVHAYFCTAWDNYLAERHPEWLAVKRDRTTYLPKFDEAPGWTALCIANEDFVRLMESHTEEFTSRYELDGVYFDMPIPIAGECFCHMCLRQLRDRKLDPRSVKNQREHKQELEKRFLERLRRVVLRARPGCQVDFNNQGVFGFGDRVPFMDNIDIEALPSAAMWGYYYFPLIQRYVRTFGITTYGMSGRFKASWADFGGLKLPAQIEVEVASMVANGARCDLGDQMPPSGRLDPAVYYTIGKAYGHIKRIEPYLTGAVPVVEAGMLISGLPLEHPNTPANLGFTKLLTECRVQFDAVEPSAEWERYRLLVLPDELEVSEALAARVQRYVSAGGSVLVSHRAGLIHGNQKSWLEPYGLECAGMSPFAPAYMLPKEQFTGEIPAYEYALYQGASRWCVREPATVVAQLGEPAFQRSAAHYTSHAQTPMERLTEYAAIARSGRVALFGFPLGTSYFRQGYWVYRESLKHILRSLLPVPVVESNAPVSTEIEVTHQDQPERYLVHIVNWSANRGTPQHPVFHEEPIPLTDVTVRLNVPVRGSVATAAVSGSKLAIRRSGSGVEVTVPRVAIHEVIAFEH
jgi:hypothetical protein